MPWLHIFDAFVRTKFENARLEIEVKLRNAGERPAAGSIGFSLLDHLGQPVGLELPDAELHVDAGDIGILHTTGEVSRPRLWSAESPYLYTLLISLKEAGQRVAEVVPFRNGIHEVTIEEGMLRVRGPDFEFVVDPLHGRVISWIYENVPLIVSGPLLVFWRAPTDNDRGGGRLNRSSLADQWRRAGLNALQHRVDGFSVKKLSDQLRNLIYE